MAEIRRIFVEKRPGFDVEARQWMANVKEHLGMDALQGVRIINRYDVQGMEDGPFEQAKQTIFAEPNADFVYEEQCPIEPGWQAFAMESLPGQYDQRADSAAQCAQILNQGNAPLIRTAKVYALKGALTERQMQAIQAYCINPVESRLASMDKPETLALDGPAPGDIPRIEGFMHMDAAAIAALHARMGLAMSVEDLAYTQSYFREIERREPTETEIRVLDTYWSDHCRHTTFATILDEIILPEGRYKQAFQSALELYEQARAMGGRSHRPKTMMDLGTVGTKALKARGGIDDLDESEEINACSVKMTVNVDGVDEPWLLQYKNETHNHPTEIEPFGGAATCLGGAIRDILAGRGYAHQAMRVSGAADPHTPMDQTVPGRLPQRQITTGAAAGFSSYGNQIGLATGQVTEIYDPGYVAKRMEVGAVVGACRESDVVRTRPEPGDVVVLLGGRTGRDGIGGATGSSVSHNAQSLSECGSQVQKGNAPTERKIQRLMKNGEVTKLIKRCNDFGAGGVSVAIGELADGLAIDLDKVPKKYEGLNGTELAISESQERMAMVLAPKNVKAFLQAAEEENMEARIVAQVTEQPRLVMRWRGDVIVDMSRAFLDTNGVTQHAKATILPPEERDVRAEIPQALQGKTRRDALLANLKQLNVCAQKGLVERFDSSIGANTVLMPFAGKTQLTPEEAMVAKFPVSGETDDATAMAFGFTPALANWSPMHAGAFAVAQSLMRLAAVGADARKARLSFQEYFESLKSNPQSWGKPVAALLGALSAQMGFGTPSIGGKDSMSGTFKEYNVPPTLISFAIVQTKASKTVSAALQPGQTVYRIALPVDGDGLPDYAAIKQILKTVYAANENGHMQAAAVVREGGMAATLFKMCVGNDVGFVFEQEPDEQALFAMKVGDLLIAVDDAACLKGLAAQKLGVTDASGVWQMGGERIGMAEMRQAWLQVLSDVFPIAAQDEPMMLPIDLYPRKNEARPAVRIAKPRVLIPVFPGTNCEIDTARAFEKAGAVSELVIVNNLSPAGIEQTIERLAKGIANSQILMLPGGFSAGDEPDGSGKFIAVTLRNPRIADAITELLEKRDGLALGICNGFQALIKLGLLPQGRICDIAEDAPTLTYNDIGRHVSTMVRTRVTSTLSPWLSLCKAGDVHTVPVSHGEGRFVASEADIRALAANGQIATQYVDETGEPCARIPHNPNGSYCAIEGICSPDGRVLGKMAHSERIGANIAKNVPGEQDQRIFEAGVRYFSE